jgi:hypothetical protein
VNGAKLVTKEEKERLDEWYVRNASLWLDLQITVMSIKVILKGRVSSQEVLADTDQVRSRISVLSVAAEEMPTRRGSRIENDQKPAADA